MKRVLMFAGIICLMFSLLVSAEDQEVDEIQCNQSFLP